jgi:vacuolar protein sorting-associated protein 13A/C
LIPNLNPSLTFDFTELVYETDPKDYVLKPTSFALIIKRNLSSGWYKDLPQMEISGRLFSIELNVIAQDYKVIMQILEKNMTEGQNEFKKPRKQRAVTTPNEPSKGKKNEI